MTNYTIRRRPLLSGSGDYEYSVHHAGAVICRRLSEISAEEAEAEIRFVAWRKEQDEIERKRKLEIATA